MRMIKMMILLSTLSLFSLEAMDAMQKDAIRPGVYIDEIDNQTDEHMRVGGYAVESGIASGFSGRRNYTPQYDMNHLPIMYISKTVCPGQKFTQLIPIQMSEPMIDGRYPASVAHIRIEPTDHPADNQYFWLHKENKPNAMDFFILARDKKHRCNFHMHEESVTSGHPNSLITLLKVVIEKADPSGMKMTSQTLEKMPEKKNGEQSTRPRRIIIRRKK